MIQEQNRMGICIKGDVEKIDRFSIRNTALAEYTNTALAEYTDTALTDYTHTALTEYANIKRLIFSYINSGRFYFTHK
jgi:hypothetical protein